MKKICFLAFVFFAISASADTYEVTIQDKKEQVTDFYKISNKFEEKNKALKISTWQDLTYIKSCVNEGNNKVLGNDVLKVGKVIELKNETQESINFKYSNSDLLSLKEFNTANCGVQTPNIKTTESEFKINIKVGQMEVVKLPDGVQVRISRKTDI